MNKLNLDYVPKEVFKYKEYLDFMESKKVRKGKDTTYTLLDFVTEEQREIDKKEKSIINNLTSYDPTPKEIQEHFNFVTKTFNYLKEKYPNDEYLISLENEENMQIIKCSFDWYKKYGIEK
ncbi:hypothetical protein [Arcobacter defluvii]|uniref:Uncharacterized protein n=1 Tax=Arcobacter defluvii TaxID=873191 RepID=A0AAE7E6G8_9BACT|nr:hypothetical protein [Arcobacter defluvii]QKF77271.1 hypothetical protein ADFLV_1239 [Arcobacter defluvii]QKF77885.1 hypothetical protein ADFLV_1867 [Arcobacter defluvii]RXI32666.1 hypothetical protein CP964_07310 [Arcobacter defluvii]